MVVVPLLVLIVTWRTPNARACSSLYQSLTVPPATPVQAAVGSKKRNTSLSLNATNTFGLAGVGVGLVLAGCVGVAAG